MTVPPGESWIVYQGGTAGPARIRLVRPDGTGDHTLIDSLVPGGEAGDYQHPDWSHDGQRIALQASEPDGTSDLWVVNADGTGATKVYDCALPCGYADFPAWSPDDSSIAFVSADHVGNGPDSTSHLEILDLATMKRRVVITATDLAWFYGPRWAPDGRRLVVEATRFATARFDEEETTASTIGIVDLDAASPSFERVLPWSSWASHPDWDPHGDRLVFQLPFAADKPFDGADIALLELGTKEPLVITTFGPIGWAIQPTWTPDGSAISFVAEDVVRTHPNAALVLPDGSGLARLSNDGFFRTHPRLRP